LVSKMEISEIVYFAEPGPGNTAEILRISRKRVETLKIRDIIIASNQGRTVREFLKVFGDTSLHVLVITNSKGSRMPVSFLYEKYSESKDIKADQQRRGMKDYPISISHEKVKELEEKGIEVFFIPDILGIGGTLGSGKEKRSTKTILDAFLPRHLRPLDIVAGADLSLLNIISYGFRVCVGITAVSVINGFVPQGRLTLAIAGTGFAGGGADTAVILQAHSNPKRCYVKEIIGFPKAK